MALSKIEVDTEVYLSLLFQLFCLYVAIAAFVIPSLLFKIWGYISEPKSDQHFNPWITETRGRRRKEFNIIPEEDTITNNDDG